MVMQFFNSLASKGLSFCAQKRDSKLPFDAKPETLTNGVAVRCLRLCECDLTPSLYPACLSTAAFYLFCLLFLPCNLACCADFGYFPVFFLTPPNRADSAARNGRNTFFTPPCLRRHCRHLQKSSFQLLASESVTGAGLNFVQRVDIG